jgi:hypothetical protein
MNIDRSIDFHQASSDRTSVVAALPRILVVEDSLLVADLIMEVLRDHR